MKHRKHDHTVKSVAWPKELLIASAHFHNARGEKYRPLQAHLYRLFTKSQSRNELRMKKDFHPWYQICVERAVQQQSLMAL
jgi:hypothetical protein